MISRLLEIIGLFCRISSFLWGSFAKKTCNFKERNSRSHPLYEIAVGLTRLSWVFEKAGKQERKKARKKERKKEKLYPEE